MTEENKFDNNEIKKIVDEIVLTYKDDSGINFIDASYLPEREKILQILDHLTEILFPGYTGRRVVSVTNISFIVGDILCSIYDELTNQTERAYKYACRLKNCEGCDCRTKAENATKKLLNRLPEIRELLKGDVAAAYDGDPAAQSFDEVVLSYPGITAIAIYRIAHELYLEEVPLIPRIMSECAHSKTGIDIHPGATIGKNFFIDHGTGVVIGETTIIGNNVKIYQGTTLGAMSFPKDERGNIIKGTKRHPTIEDNVTIYAEATILGDIVIGKGSVIGGNVWIKEPVPPGVTVIARNTELIFKKNSDKK